ncbi:DNA replication protein DnaC [Streptacidiphilus sp. EB129]
MITSGTGKSHFTEALGQAAVEAGMTVAWFTIEDLGALVRRHRADDSIARALARIIRSDLIIVDLCRDRDYAKAVCVVPLLRGVSALRGSA